MGRYNGRGIDDMTTISGFTNNFTNTASINSLNSLNDI